MENVPPLATAAELEIRAARVADPGCALKDKVTAVNELRELIDIVRDSDANRILPNMITVLLEVLRSGEPAFKRDTFEFALRRTIVDILHRVPYHETVRPLALNLINGLLHVLRHDNEENGVLSCKTIIDLTRYFRIINEETVAEFMSVLTVSFQNMKDLVVELLSEESEAVDPNVVLPSTKSFRVLSEMCMTIVTFSQSHRPLLNKHVPALLPLNFEVLTLESPAQKAARENYEAMGGFWTGVAPTIKNVQAYGEFIHAQIKMISYSAYILRGLEEYDKYGNTLVLTGLRLFQDCPPNAVGSRRDLIIVMRHLLSTTPYRRALLPHVDKLFDEDVLLGKGVGARETLRASVYVALADFVHHLRPELTTNQMARIANVYATLMHNQSLMSNVHIMFAKVIINLADGIVQKDNRQLANRALTSLLESCIERLEAMNTVQHEVSLKLESQRNGEQTVMDYASMDKSRPVAGAMYALEKPEEVLHEARLLFRPLMLCCRACLLNLKRTDGPVPDGILISRLFEGCIKAMNLYDVDPREGNDAMETFGQTLVEVNLHVVQEVWTQKMGFFFDSAQRRPTLLQICQSLFGKEPISPTLIAIVLRFLIDRLSLLGDTDDQTAVVTIRLYKMAFAAVGIFPQTNEPILAAHIGKLIMACFPLAAKATKPANYYFLLRALFRAIGGGGGRFELLYKEVLPLLPDLLESLNRQLQASQGLNRDMIVELCLIVPLRLTHLLPHLSYLMRPLVYALRGPLELASQGLRTLELCIDNLTPDFLDPTLNTVLRELTEALHSHLKPLPASHHHSSSAARILGKLGGRNRRLLMREPALNYHPYSEPATFALSFSGRVKDIDLVPMSTLALRVLRGSASSLRTQAYNYLENCITILAHDGVQGYTRQEVFSQCLEGVFDAVHIPDIASQAEDYIHKISQLVFRTETRKSFTKDMGVRRHPSPLLACYLDALPHALARDERSEAQKAQDLVSSIIKGLIELGNSIMVSPQDVIPTLHQIASRFSGLCFEDTWVRKSAGCAGIKIMTCTPDVGVKWITDREVDLVRTLLHVLKDLPSDLPRDVDEVLDVLKRVLRVSNADLPPSTAQGADDALNVRNKISNLTGIFFAELSSPSAIVREAVQGCIELLAELSGKPAVELLLPHRDRMLATIYTKPLRALPLPIQIGMVEAVRYCISLDPPLPELNEELLRLLHETLALADADDANLLGRGNPRQGGLDIINLRVAAIKLLTASMPMTDFFSKHTATRQRVTTVYFKSLYSSSPEVKEVAHEGLRTVLSHQSRLPKELLQTGLRPILMNLADPKRLSVPGLEGLARLLELLTNYFKVEIGHKLLDHFRVVADPQMLQESSRLPLTENEGITKLVRLANIFHLLPSAANIFLDALVNAIVQTEAQMHFSGQSPFSEPLAKYLDKYPIDAVDFFMRHLHFPRHMRTLRTILQANLAPSVLRELASRTSTLVTMCFYGNDQSLIMPGLEICSDLNKYVPDWLHHNGYALGALVKIWNLSPGTEQAAVGMDLTQRYSLILSIFEEALKQSPRIDILFEIVAIYTRSVPLDLMKLSHFLYRHVASRESLAYKRNILTRFLIWFKDESVPWPRKAYFMRSIITPMLLRQASGTIPKEGLLDEEIIAKVHASIWRPMLDDAALSEADGMFKVELLHFTTVMVQHYHDMLEPVKKEVIRCAWFYISHEDPVVKQTAYLLAARFFEAFDTPQKFILRAWTGLLKQPHTEVRATIRQALDIIAPVLLRSGAQEPGNQPTWARTTRKLLAEEGTGLAQIMIVYQVIVRQPQLFYHVRALFVPHMVNCLARLGLSVLAHNESRLLSIDILQVIFDWDQKTISSGVVDETPASGDNRQNANWVTPMPFRETMVSYLVRLATAPHEPPARNILVPRALALLRTMVGTPGWSEVTVKLHYFARALEQNELNNEATLSQAISSAKVLQIVSADKGDAWYHANAAILQKLIRKGLMSEDAALHDALHPVFDHLIRLFPLPSEDEEQQSDMSEFHRFVYSTIGEGLRNGTTLRGVLLMLKSVVQAIPERIKPFSPSIAKLLQKLFKDHTASAPGTPNFDMTVRLTICLLDICQLGILFLGDDRRALLQALVLFVDKSKSPVLCKYLLDLARDWAIQKRDAFPTVKEKAALLQRMVAFETRGEALFNSYLELILDIYTDASLRRSDLTTRLEQAFLTGCRCREASLREKFMDLLDSSIPRNLPARLAYVLGVQSWEALAEYNWIYIALHLLLGTVDGDHDLIDERKGSLDPALFAVFGRRCAQEVVRPLQRLLFLDHQVAHDIWLTIFPAAWGCLSRREQTDITQHVMILLSREYHLKQAELRPNVIQSLLAGVHACIPPITLPPHLLKYLAKNYGTWHVSLELLESSLDHLREDEIPVRDTIYDSLAEVFAELSEDDLFYGLWRRRSLHSETNIAIAFEQNGMWEQAAVMYETAQSKTRSGAIPFSEPEFCLWEDHWMLAAEKLQQWDILFELARNEGNVELQLESAWRIKNWAEERASLEELVNSLPDIGTPRRRVFEAFIALLKLPETYGASGPNATAQHAINAATQEVAAEVTKILEDATQLSLRKWIALPPYLSPAHVPLLQHFQQFVELTEAIQIFNSLASTTASNLEKKSAELKIPLQAWRERLPDRCDDISLWSDLVAWRQNVFHAINKRYIPLIPQSGPNANGAAGTSNTFGYRGFHETAWIINRFAHVARKHDLLDVCFTYLNKIYTLPNIEISEAFLKLREQARCHYQKPNDLQAGLEVINNTNLMYFSSTQKAEFFTLKGMFHARVQRYEDANHAFGSAVQLDMNQAKAWAEWGKFNDRMFKERPNDMTYAAHAVSCYLQAAGLHKNGKSRPLLTRVLWLLSVDDGQFTISRAFDTYKGDAAFWYWITLIPQLCLSISQREVKQARYLLLNLAKLYPQALFFPLRTTKEDMAIVKRQAAAAAAARASSGSSHGAPSVQQATTADVARRTDVDHPMRDATNEVNETKKENDSVGPSQSPAPVARSGSDGTVPDVQRPAPPISGAQTGNDASAYHPMRQAWEYVEEVVNILKTAFPLLILSLETLIDQINQRFKATPEEDIYRFVCMLLLDGVNTYLSRVPMAEDDGQLPPQTQANLQRMVGNLTGPARKDYEEDFLKSKLTQLEYIGKLQQWRDRYEKYLDSRPRVQPLDLLSHYLTEFQYGKFDEIEVPGQYTEDKDSNQNFIRIQKFGPKFENCRSHGYCFRRLTIHGSDSSKTSFAVQLPSGRHCRREERVMQLFRTFNGTLSRKKESRKRNLTFHLPAAVSCGTNLRLLQNDSSYINLGDIYDQYCEDTGVSKEDPILVVGEKIKTVLREFNHNEKRLPSKAEYFTLKKDVLDEVVLKLVPDDILFRYMLRTMDGPSEFWRMRKQFTLQIAATSFMTWTLCLTSRLPSRFHVSRATGQIAMSELLPGVAANLPQFATPDTVPFRFTPNMQRFVGPIMTEGLLTTSMMAIGRCLTEPEFDLEQQLCLFARDEVITWLHLRNKPWNAADITFRNHVAANIDAIVKKAETMACKVEREQAVQNPSNPATAPVVQTVTNLISSATNPINLAKMQEVYSPWF
ncbi:hypothetical protein GLOTRDRAFT_136350 [Gloeophyllum trabeum ATCC 11539]|uniref:Atypical/PIKK/TRRAP protein kinase n=1 Tax=Gloeophyllum trabeum (strain ATCC 11539 / FP-39264 / Madison 617) TaxID=670483 RepID=S7RX90_GLOTA|nr:uncharacterized protein GLOTRDRAFT_136350 [Gloeophyllum trabeum ATCC 11539]EPQ59490.1 hypothetical protein GLOTRDRAFT_136350 [Gloeophyllum trabeum ATCC 11539]